MRCRNAVLPAGMLLDTATRSAATGMRFVRELHPIVLRVVGKHRIRELVPAAAALMGASSLHSRRWFTIAP